MLREREKRLDDERKKADATRAMIKAQREEYLTQHNARHSATMARRLSGSFSHSTEIVLEPEEHVVSPLKAQATGSGSQPLPHQASLSFSIVEDGEEVVPVVVSATKTKSSLEIQRERDEAVRLPIIAV